jgi:tetratricopeptide (TPR) repeat protein
VSSRRPVILMGVLLLALAYFGQQHFDILGLTPAPKPAEPPLPGKNTISNLTVHQDAMGTWTAEFDYFYTGNPAALLARIELSPLAAGPGAENTPLAAFERSTFVPPPKRGSHHISVALYYPGIEQTTRTVTAGFLTMTIFKGVMHRTEIASQQIDQLIDWPSLSQYAENQLESSNTPAQNLRRAQDWIERGTPASVAESKVILEKLLRQNPRFDAAYVGLARVAERSDDFGPEGLHQAESLLASALEIRPDNVDAKIVLGHVYTLQHRFSEAEKLFSESAAANASNPWLWANWGEMLSLQHKPDEAITRFRQAIAHPKTDEPNDRARKFAYYNLLSLLRQKKDLDALEGVFKQQVADYGPGSCYSSEYARFMLQVRGDTQGAIDLSKRALNKDCNDAPSREVLGLAQYVKWADTAGPERAESLNEARLYLPAGATALYQLATSDRTVAAAKQLMASGEPIDQKDSSGRTALALALEAGDLAAARRLLTLHARSDTPIGPEKVPLALIPVMEENLPAIRLLREFGVNYSQVSFRGHTAVEFAKQSGNHELLQALGGGGTSL